MPETIFVDHEIGTYKVYLTIGGYIINFLDEKNNIRPVDGGTIYTHRQNAYRRCKQLNVQLKEKIIEELIKNTCFNQPFPTRNPGYTAQIVSEGNEMENGKLEAILSIKPNTDNDIPDLMSGEALPIFFWVEAEDKVTIHWHLPASDWNADITEAWPVTPGPFLRNPKA